MLKNPRYTGAFVYGRSHAKKIAGRELRRQLPRERWHTVILDARPGYITWDDYEQNLRRLHENAQTNGADRRRSPAREGCALLQGLIICGRCGERMTVRYHVHRGSLIPEYACQKQGIEHARPVRQRIIGSGVDQAISELLVATVTPLALEVTLAVQEELQARADETDRLRRQQVDGPATRPSWRSDASFAPIRTTAWLRNHWRPTGTRSCVPWRTRKSSTSSNDKPTTVCSTTSSVSRSWRLPPTFHVCGLTLVSRTASASA